MNNFVDVPCQNRSSRQHSCKQANSRYAHDGFRLLLFHHRCHCKRHNKRKHSGTYNNNPKVGTFFRRLHRGVALCQQLQKRTFHKLRCANAQCNQNAHNASQHAGNNGANGASGGVFLCFLCQSVFKIYFRNVWDGKSQHKRRVTV